MTRHARRTRRHRESSSLIGIAFGSDATDSGFHTLAWVLGGIGIAIALLAVLDNSLPQVTK